MNYTLRCLVLPMLALALLTGCASAARTAPTVGAAPTSVPTVVPTVAPIPTVAPAPTPIPASPVVTIADRLDALFTAQAEEGSFNGAVLIMDGDEVVLRKGYGDANRVSGTANTPETAFRIGGLTKSLTAAGILLLEAQGKLSVDDLICDYIDDCPTAWESVTLHHLLTNTSGIENYTAEEPSAAYSPDELLSLVRDAPLAFAPGEGFALSQTNYVLLGMVIERASGQPYGDFLQEQLFDPVGMVATGFVEPPDTLAMGYKGEAAAGALNPSVGYAAYGLYSTVDDLYRFDQAVLAGDLLPAAQREKLVAKHKNLGEFSYGYGTMRSDTYYAGHRIVGLGLAVKDEAPYGVYPGYDSINYSLTDRGIYVVILANNENAAVAELVEPVARMLLGEI